MYSGPACLFLCLLANSCLSNAFMTCKCMLSRPESCTLNPRLGSSVNPEANLNPFFFVFLGLPFSFSSLHGVIFKLCNYPCGGKWLLSFHTRGKLTMCLPIGYQRKRGKAMGHTCGPAGGHHLPGRYRGRGGGAVSQPSPKKCEPQDRIVGCSNLWPCRPC